MIAGYILQTRDCENKTPNIEQLQADSSLKVTSRNYLR
jgi:hypothetical protein